MTSPLNLPAPGRRQALYVVFTTLQSPVFLLNSRHGHFSAASLGSESKFLHPKRPPFSRSYGGNLPSSLTRDHSSALGYSPCLPVSVCGTDTIPTPYEAFLGSVGSASLWGIRPSPSPLGVSASRIYLRSPPTGLDQHVRQLACLPFCVPPSVVTLEWWYRNINLFSIGYACRPHLRIRLTLGGLTFPRNP